MDDSSQKSVRHICARISFLMEHQEILPDLKEITAELESVESVDKDYLQGAHDALNYLFDFLKEKGCR